MKRNFFVAVCVALFSIPSFAMRDVRDFGVEEIPFIVDFDWDLGGLGDPEKEECGSPSFCYVIPIIGKPNNYIWMRGYKNSKDNLFEWQIFLLQVEYFPVEGYEDAVWVGFTNVFIPRNDGKYNNDWRSIGHELIPKDYPPIKVFNWYMVLIK